MKKFLLILIFISCKTAQPPVVEESRPSVTQKAYIAYWKSKGYEYGLVNYKIQKSKNNKNWVTIDTIAPKKLPDSNTYKFTLPKTGIPNYYRIIATMIKGTFTLDTKFLQNTNVK